MFRSEERSVLVVVDQVELREAASHRHCLLLLQVRVEPYAATTTTLTNVGCKDTSLICRLRVELKTILRR